MTPEFEVRLLVQVVDEVELATEGARVSVGGEMLFARADQQIMVLLQEALAAFVTVSADERASMPKQVQSMHSVGHRGIRVASMSCRGAD